MRLPAAASLRLVTSILLAAPTLLSAQAKNSAVDALVVRVEVGDQSARRELNPIARRMLLDWNERPRTAESARAIARVLLAMAQPLTPLDRPPRENEVDWRGPAVRSLRYAVAADSGDIASLTLLTRIAPYPYIWRAPDHELAHLRAAAARHAVVPGAILLAHFGLELEVGTTANARHVLESAPSDSLPPAIRLHLMARLAYAEGDSARGREAYRTGAAAIRSAAEVAWYFADLNWFASDAERKSWRALQLEPGAHAAWLAAFWDRQDLEDGRLPGSRLAAQFERWRFALREFRWDLDGSVAEGLPVPRRAALELGYDDIGFPFEEGIARMMYDNRYAPVDRVLDDRGRLVMRHGLPTERILTPGNTSVAQETLVWSRGSGQVVVSFSRPESNGTVTRLGMLARNYPVGDLMTICRRDARLCALAGSSSLAGARYQAERIRLAFTEARRDAEATEGNPERYRKGMSGIFQAYGVVGGGVLLTLALPAAALLPANPPQSQLAIASRWRAVIGDASSGRIVATLDTVRRWRIAVPPAGGSYLSAYAEVAVPPGNYTVTMIAGDTLHQVGAGGRIDAVPVIPLDGAALRLGDPILGRSGSGVTWRHGNANVSLNPTNAWTREDEAPLHYELDGLVVGRAYTLEVELWEADAKAKAPRTKVSFTMQASAVHQSGEQLVSFRELNRGDYRLVLRVRDPASGASAERSRSVAVRG